jgi:tRNA nucleotidyltransferase/poly(A) polymerase
MIDLDNGIKVYIVGGYVRDRLLGRECKDHDFVVVGATVHYMLSLGFTQVGADFPVFLHPTTGDEYALARTERKSGPGYQGFQVDYDPSITLEQDLFRRDLTINAMARRVTGWNAAGHAQLDDTLIDPYNGQLDLSNGTLRHVSDHFGEDPVRALRAARFAARYGFTPDQSLTDLIQKMADDGELSNLVPERTWAELEKAIDEPKPELFFKTLLDANASVAVFGFEFVNSSIALLQLHNCQCRTTRLMAMASMMGPYLDQFFQKFKAPSKFHKYSKAFRKATNAIRHKQSTERVTSEEILTFIENLDGFRDPEIVIPTMNVLETYRNPFRKIRVVVMDTFDEMKAIGFQSLTDDEKASAKGPEIGKLIRAKRLECLR